MSKSYTLLLLTTALSLATAWPSALFPRHHDDNNQPTIKIVTQVVYVQAPAATPPSNGGGDNARTYPIPDMSNFKKVVTTNDGTTTPPPPPDTNPPTTPPDTKKQTTTTTTTQGDGAGGAGGAAAATDCKSLGSAPPQGNDMKSQVLWWTNMHRCNHTDTGLLVWDEAAATNALNCAKQCKDTKTDLHNVHCDISGFSGQTYAPGIGGADKMWPNSVQMWYYGNSLSPEYHEIIGSDDKLKQGWQGMPLTHIQIMTDRANGKIGCGSAQCAGGEVRNMCTYSGGGKGTGLGNPMGQPSNEGKPSALG